MLAIGPKGAIMLSDSQFEIEKRPEHRELSRVAIPRLHLLLRSDSRWLLDGMDTDGKPAPTSLNGPSIMPDVFQIRRPAVAGNPNVRTPQREAYERLEAYFQAVAPEREVGIVLPVGCGKSGMIALAPFAVRSRRTLVVAPGLNIASQLAADFDPTNPNMFYQKCRILDGAPFPEPVMIRGTTTNRADLEEAEVVVTNIQQLQGDQNRWLQSLPPDFFDLILFDEGPRT
jgi:superfamily II DNA or RNA helicase